MEGTESGQIMKALYDPPFLIKKLFKRFNWNTVSNEALLTFDDGPTVEATEKILMFLNQHKLKAIFFCVGNNINRRPELAKEILAEGHLIGNHTFNHKRITGLTREEIKRELGEFDKTAEEKLAYKTQLFRPPHGLFTFTSYRLLNEMDKKAVLWSLLTYDYKNDIEEVKKSLKYMKRNSIIVFHDSIKSERIIIDSLNLTLEQADKYGIKFGEPSECLK
ncbi:MAG TPA: polysaccharide deacetylase family protein [Ignavibacteriales bacterium]|nr:polysaccharide deacetylase family protein [Ignavibacteriales bacterium]